MVMRAVDFYADCMKWEGTVWYRKEETLRLPTLWDKLFYCRICSGSKRDEYTYEYYLLKEKKDYDMHRFFLALVGVLDGYTAEKQYKILKRMETIELDVDLTEEEMRSASWNPNPLFSVRGTCGQEKTCKRDCACRTIYFESCCHDGKVGFSKLASITNPQYYAFLTDLVVWKALCPDLDALFVMHDCPPSHYNCGRLNCRYAFVIKDDRITYVKGTKKVERLYHIYNKKYPCDTSETENRIQEWCTEPVEFHF